MLTPSTVRFHLAALALFVLAAAPLAAQDLPQTISYQGVLTNPSGQPVPDGTYALTLRLFSQATGGSANYAETHTVTTIDGAFSLLIGDGTFLIQGFGNERFREPQWVEIEVGGTVLSPRTPFQAVPYARTLVPRAILEGRASDAIVTVENDGTGLGDGIRGTGPAVGLRGTATGTNGFGVVGTGVGGAGILGSGIVGVQGVGLGTSGVGVEASVTTGSGSTVGVSGTVSSPDGLAGVFTGGRGLHVETLDLALPASAQANEDLAVESDDAIVGLYSNANGSWGSALALGEINAGALTNKWTVARGTGASAPLRFTFGTSADYAANNTLMRIDTDGTVRADGSFVGGGADFAEFFPLATSGTGSASVQPGDLVGLRGGRVSLDTEAAEQVMIASSDPAFVGNPDAEAGGALMALVGQAEVCITGAASVGDLLVASGLDDGTARAVTPEAYRPEVDGPVAGRVLALPEAGRAIALVGVDEAAALRTTVAALQADRDRLGAEVAALADRVEAQQRELDALRAQVGHAETLEARLAHLEARLTVTAER
ncbi:MAG: hypothetical protein AAF845_02985 [Bacteroidota bacterium]